LDEKDLTPKQRKWLEASRKIGSLAMTKSERQTLERLYADMLPQEQQDLLQYVQDTFGKKSDETEPDPTSIMEARVWSTPSAGLKKAFAGSTVSSAQSTFHAQQPTQSPASSSKSSMGGMAGALEKYRFVAEDLASRGISLDVDEIERMITKVERLHDDLSELRRQSAKLTRPAADDRSVAMENDVLAQEIQDREKDLERAEKDLKGLLKPVSDILNQ
jgi:hypothetical protein